MTWEEVEQGWGCLAHLGSASGQ